MFPDLAEIFLQERNAGTLEPEVLLDKSEANQASGHYAPSEFNITAFIADLSVTMANIAAILLIVENQSN